MVSMYTLAIVNSIAHTLKHLHCVCIATAIEQHTPTGLLNAFKRLNSLSPGPNRCNIKNRNIIN